MLIVNVDIWVKPDCIEAFKTATIENCRNSINEPGIAQFDFIAHQEDPNRFMLVEAYLTDDAPAAHKATAHYAAWRDAVADMMAQPRQAQKFTDVYLPVADK